jgi:putative glutamine amidotransferase
MKPPLIGITPDTATLDRPDKRGSFCRHEYTRALENTGFVPVILPLTTKRPTLEKFLTRCDAFLFSGGGDLHETTGAYGRNITTSERATLSGLNTDRDNMELYLARRAAEENIPALGICRGHQIMNVALGGTLLPDIPNHRNVTHHIAWTTTARGPCRLARVNSIHHQAVARLAPALIVTARADDGTIEAFELPGATFFVGVQFHPERMMPRAAPLFRALFNACRHPRR